MIEEEQGGKRGGLERAERLQDRGGGAAERLLGRLELAERDREQGEVRDQGNRESP